MHTWTLVVASTGLVGLAAFTPTATRAETHAPVPPPVPHVATTAVHAEALVTPAAPDIDVRSLRRHAQSIAKLIGHPAREVHQVIQDFMCGFQPSAK